MTAVDVAPADLKAALRYAPTSPLGRESVVPNDEIQQRALAEFGSAEAFRDAVVGRIGTPPLDQLPTADLPVDQLGAPYLPSNEAATAERSTIVEVDPDVIDRGTQGHAKTQNLLADHVRLLGFEPRRWSGAEPPYDLAWEQDGAIYLAEVKSLTRQNEERRLRLALGQVLRYDQQLAYKQKVIKKVIAVEREPSDSSWVALCEAYGVSLVWPETFDLLT